MSQEEMINTENFIIERNIEVVEDILKSLDNIQKYLKKFELNEIETEVNEIFNLINILTQNKSALNIQAQLFINKMWNEKRSYLNCAEDLDISGMFHTLRRIKYHACILILKLKENLKS